MTVLSPELIYDVADRNVYNWGCGKSRQTVRPKYQNESRIARGNHGRPTPLRARLSCPCGVL